MKIYAKRPVHLVPGIMKQRGWHGGFFGFGRLELGPRARRFFNCSLLRHRDEDWLFVRLAEDVSEHRFGQNSIWAFRLDRHHVPVEGKKLTFPTGYDYQHFEDPRVTRFDDGRIALSYTTFVIEVSQDIPGMTSWYGAHQAIAFLDDDLSVVEIIDPLYAGNGGSVLQNGTGAGGGKINQKNWNWFQHDGAVHLVYMTEPHEVVRWSWDWKPEEVYRMQTVMPYWSEFGHPRGGTPPVRIGDEYWSFFHSSTDWKEWNRDHPGDWKRRYHMGVYAFEAKPPFHITRVSEIPLLTASRMDPWMPGLPLVVFPCGAILRDRRWFISMGINDCAAGWIEVDHRDVENLTTPYESQKRAETSPAPPKIAQPQEGNRDGAQNGGMADGQVECGGGGPTPIPTGNAGDGGNCGGYGAFKGRRRMRRRKIGQT